MLKPVTKKGGDSGHRGENVKGKRTCPGSRVKRNTPIYLWQWGRGGKEKLKGENKKKWGGEVKKKMLKLLRCTGKR